MRSVPSFAVAFAAAAIGSALSACAGNQSSSNWISPQSGIFGRAQLAVRRGSGSSKIQHVVIVVQENRSLNNLFYGFPGTKTVTFGYTSTGKKVTIKPIPLETTWDLEHSAEGFFLSCNGTGSIPGTNCRMNGFDKEWTQCGMPRYPKCPNANPQYAYVPHSETKPYFDIGNQYVLADQMYASNLDESSFIGHQYIIAAQAEASVNYPSSAWGCEGASGDEVPIIGPDRQIPDGQQAPCFKDNSLGEEADGAGVSWAFYTGPLNGVAKLWSAYEANKYVYDGPDWTNDVITPQTQLFTDISNGNLRQISWVTPTCANSDHAGCGGNGGPDWVASIVNAIGQSQYWDNTAIFVTWDDPGGWFDEEPPAYADYDGLGIRVPMLVVSAYAKPGYVSHVHYEYGSILKFTEDIFGLARLSASDTRATSPASDCFNFNKPPRTFKVIPSALGRQYFMHQPLDLRPPDNE